VSESTSVYADHVFLHGSGNNSWSNLFSLIPDGSRVLDVGCSTGHFGAALQELKGCTVIGVDLNEADILEARKILFDAQVLDITRDGAVESLGMFDVVVFADVIEHLVDPRGALRRIREILNEGGMVAYSIPHMGHLSVRLDLLEGRFPYRELGLLDRTHLHYYDRAEINGVFDDAGFVVSREAPVVSRYPEEWVRRRLAGLGLSVNDVFFEMLENTDSHVFQYVGTAVRKGVAPSSPREPAGYVMPPDEIYEFAQSILVENEALRTRLEEFRSGLPFVAYRQLRHILRRK
jgi:2-polyprenyl-3-methyl-5-hydroxy-6-metoxy-1,4-benzoquinol methylase